MCNRIHLEEGKYDSVHIQGLNKRTEHRAVTHIIRKVITKRCQTQHVILMIITIALGCNQY